MEHMNKLLLASLIFTCSLGFGQGTYESRLESFWKDVCFKRKVDCTRGFLPRDIKNFIEESASQMNQGEKVIITFYPKNCGWDRVLDQMDGLIDAMEFRQLSEENGFKINFCLPQRHLVYFENLSDLESYAEEQFGQSLKSPHLKFPARMIIAELEKL